MTAYVAPGLQSPEEIIAMHWNTTVEQMRCRTRERHVVEARQVAMWYLMRFNGYTESQAAQVFNRDHSTAHHAKKTVCDLIHIDRRFRSRVMDVVTRLEKIAEKSNNE